MARVAASKGPSPFLQNAVIDADMGEGTFKYLLQQTELFAHFAKGDQSSSQKKVKGMGRHASKVTEEEEEEDEEYLKEEEDGIQGKMRDYQLSGLNWLIRLYENGINGILADEMNDLHELWSLLNFLLPEIFSSAETFDDCFQISGENDQQEVVQQLHKASSSTISPSEIEIKYRERRSSITNAGKMFLLDKLLPKLKERDSRVLIFSQMTRLLDILEDYLMFRGYLYCRIDGNTGGEDRDASIEAFNKPGSEKFVFLLSTRVGGLVFRFCTEYTIEEKVIERAYKKLALDVLAIPKGRLAEQKTVNKDELLQMVRFGAEMVFGSKDSTITDEDIDRIIAKGEVATAELDAKMKKFTKDAINFKMDDTAELYDFDDDKGENKLDFKKIVSENWIEPPKRGGSGSNYTESEYFKQTVRQGGPAKSKEPQIPRMRQLHDFQFFNTQRLSELYEKEVCYLMQTHQKNQIKDTIDVDEPEQGGDPLTAEELEEKERLLEEGFSSWSRRDFNTFIRACEKYGRNDIKDYERIIKNIERGEARISRKDEIMKAIGKKLDWYKNPWLEMKIQYGQNKGKLYNEECDQFIICMVHKLGCGNWEELKAAFRTSPLFRFGWFVKFRTTQELARRFDAFVRLVKKANQEYDERERQARKEKKLTKNMTPSKRGGRQPTESPTQLKKQKQLPMDDYVILGKKRK
ncbi:hypothetical protein CRYUN_Cryun18bG0017900 [Craigia yunnanensis]